MLTEASEEPGSASLPGQEGVQEWEWLTPLLSQSEGMHTIEGAAEDRRVSLIDFRAALRHC